MDSGFALTRPGMASGAIMLLSQRAAQHPEKASADVQLATERAT
jgi:hypothetical protein